MSDEKKSGDLVELCGLWKLPSGKGYSGSLGGARVLVLENKNKRGDRAPDFRIFLARNEKRGEGGERSQHSERRAQPSDSFGDDEPSF